MVDYLNTVRNFIKRFGESGVLNFDETALHNIITNGLGVGVKGYGAPVTTVHGNTM